MATELPFYDLVRDASENSKQLADALRQTIEDFRGASSEVTDHDVADAIRLLSLDYTG